MTVRLAAAFALVVAGFALVAYLLTPTPAARPAPAPVAVQPAVHAAAAPDPFLAALVGDATDLAPEQATTLSAAADRVCEGLTSGVPEGFMIRELSGELHLTLDEAHRLVETAASVRCAA